MNILKLEGTRKFSGKIRNGTLKAITDSPNYYHYCESKSICTYIRTSVTEGPFEEKDDEPNSTLVPCLNETLWVFERLAKPVPFPLE